MAAIELLLSQARRHCTPSSSKLSQLLRYSVQSSLRPASSSLGFHRSLCSSSSSSPKPDSPEENGPSERPNGSQTPRIQPVSYAAKPKDPSLTDANRPESTPPPNAQATEAPRVWTREDFRYVKDVPRISPVSYPSRVAPLPDDHVSGVAPLPDDHIAAVASGAGREAEGDGPLEREAIRIAARKSRWSFRVDDEEEKEKLPFPTLIKQEHKKEKVIYDLQEAIRLVKANAKADFGETVEIHVNLTPELRRTDLKLDGVATLPHGTGKAVKIAVFADGPAADEARASGANVVGGPELVEGIANGTVKVYFDICITTRQFVPQLRKLAKFLRSRMPSVNSGTVTDDIAKAVKEAKKIVKITKKDKAAVVHAGIGKVSFAEEAICENVGAFVNALLLAKPAGLKKSSKYAGYVNSVHVCSTMGPGFPVSIQSISIAADRYNKLHLS